MERPVHGHQIDCIDVVVVHYLQLLPRDWSRLTLKQIQTCRHRKTMAFKVEFKQSLLSLTIIKDVLYR